MSNRRNGRVDWPVVLFLLVGLTLEFTYGGIWSGLIMLVIGVIALGWRKRQAGPFPTKKESDFEDHADRYYQLR